jgi:hypothetical protein
MSIAKQIEQLQDYPERASEEFRRQLERARDARLQFDGDVGSAGRGIDRSRELLPLPRPRIVRTLVGK